MDQKDIYAALGLDAPAEQPEVADPAENGSTGGNAQPVTGAAAGDPGADPSSGASRHLPSVGEGRVAADSRRYNGISPGGEGRVAADSRRYNGISSEGEGRVAADSRRYNGISSEGKALETWNVDEDDGEDAADYRDAEEPSGAARHLPSAEGRLGDAAGRIPAEPGKASPTGGGDTDDVAERPTEGPSSALRAPSPEGEGKGTPMSRAERAEQARLRRERETQARIDAALAAQQAKHDEELKEIFSAAGLTNRYREGARIQTAQDFEQWKKDFAGKQFAERLQSGELTQEDFQRAVDASPAMQEVRTLAEQLRAGREREQQQEFARVVEQELAQIRSSYDPNVRTVQDILDGPNGDVFAKYVNEHNLSFLEAYKLANQERIVAARSQAAQVGAARAAGSKEHLTAYGRQNAGGGVRVPARVREMYRALMPEMSDEDIRRDYAARNKE